MIWWIISVLPQQIPSWYSWKTKGMTQKNPKMQTLKSLNHMMKLYHVTVNNRIYLTRYDCCKSQSIVLRNFRLCSRPGEAICNAILSCQEQYICITILTQLRGYLRYTRMPSVDCIYRPTTKNLSNSQFEDKICFKAQSSFSETIVADYSDTSLPIVLNVHHFIRMVKTLKRSIRSCKI